MILLTISLGLLYLISGIGFIVIMNEGEPEEFLEGIQGWRDVLLVLAYPLFLIASGVVVPFYMLKKKYE